MATDSPTHLSLLQEVEMQRSHSRDSFEGFPRTNSSLITKGNESGIISRKASGIRFNLDDEPDPVSPTTPIRPRQRKRAPTLGAIFGNNSFHRPPSGHATQNEEFSILELVYGPDGGNDRSPATGRDYDETDMHFHNCTTQTLVDDSTRSETLDRQMVPAPSAKPSWVACIMSGIINGVVIYAFCNVFASIIFGQNEVLEPTMSSAVGMGAISAALGGLLVSLTSGCKTFIAGPDINPAVIIVGIAASISESLMVDEHYGPCKGGYAGGKFDSLATDGSCYHADMDTADSQVVPTVIFAAFSATLLIGFFWLSLGWFHLTRVVQFIPASVLRGFLASIGYKIMKTALESATGNKFKFDSTYLDTMFTTWKSWKLILPALPIGIPLYFLKKHHVGKPTTIFPIFIVTPLVVFYGIKLIGGIEMEELYHSGWFFKEVEQGKFWKQWEAFNVTKINFGVWAKTLPQYCILLVIASLDFMLKLAGSEKALSVEVNFDHEFKWAGATNLLLCLFVGSPAYSQAKFNVLNYNIIHSTDTRLPSLICAFFNLGMWFSAFPLINYMPRFFLAGLLIFAGMGFVVENLWDARHLLTRKEYLTVWVIMICNAVFGLLPAVGIGLGLAILVFMYQYATLDPIKMRLNGGEYECAVIRRLHDEEKVEQLGTRMLHILILQGYIFFGSGSQIQETVGNILWKKQNKETNFKFVRYLIMDFDAVTGIDYTSCDTFVKIASQCKRSSVIPLWSGMSQKVYDKLRFDKALIDEAVFPDLDTAVGWVDEQMLRFSAACRKKWLQCDLLMYLHASSQLHVVATAFHSIFEGGVNMQHLLKHCQRKSVDTGEVVFNTGDNDFTLYFLQEGKLNMYTRGRAGEDRKIRSMLMGTWFNDDSHFLRIPAQATVKAATPCVLQMITEEEMSALQAEEPVIANEVTKSILRHALHTRWKLSKELNASGFSQAHRRARGGPSMAAFFSHRHPVGALLGVALKRAIESTTHAEEDREDDDSGSLDGSPHASEKGRDKPDPTSSSSVRVSFELPLNRLCKSEPTSNYSIPPLTPMVPASARHAFDDDEAEFSTPPLSEEEREQFETVYQLYINSQRTQGTMSVTEVTSLSQALYVLQELQKRREAQNEWKKSVHVLPESVPEDILLEEFLAIVQLTIMSRLSKKTEGRVRQTFKHFDDDKSGYLAIAEVQNMIQSHTPKPLTNDEVSALVAELDTNRDGNVSEDDFVAVFSRLIRRAKHRNKLIRGFKKFLHYDTPLYQWLAGRGFPADPLFHKLTQMGVRANTPNDMSLFTESQWSDLRPLLSQVQMLRFKGDVGTLQKPTKDTALYKWLVSEGFPRVEDLYQELVRLGCRPEVLDDLRFVDDASIETLHKVMDPIPWNRFKETISEFKDTGYKKKGKKEKHTSMDNYATDGCQGTEGITAVSLKYTLEHHFDTLLTIEEAEEMVFEADTEGRGMVTFDDFVRAICNA